MVSRAIQRGMLLSKRSTNQQSRPPMKGIRISQGRITISSPCANSEQNDAEQQHGSANDGQGVPAQLAGFAAAQQHMAAPCRARYQSDGGVDGVAAQIGRASCRERV